MTQRTDSCTRSAMRRKGRRQTGAILVAALVCLLIVMAMVTTMLQGALRARRQLHTERNLRQTELLLQAAADRAAFRLLSKEDYRGETWAIPADAISGSGAGQVVVEASREAETDPWRVRIVAEYPFGSQRSIRRSRTFLMTSPTTRVQE